MKEEKKAPKKNKWKFDKSASSVFLMIATGIVMLLCVILFIRVGSLERFIRDNAVMSGDESVIDNKKNSVVLDAGSVNVMTQDKGVESVDNSYFATDSADSSTGTNDYEAYDGIVKVCLTFDDGPSANTDAILDILDDYGIKATFFVNGHEDFTDELVRIVQEGHAIGMHSYSHSYRNVYRSLDSFADDLYEIQTFIYETTGVNTNIYRFPGGSSNNVSNVSMSDCIHYLEAKGIEYYDWNVSASDAVSGGAGVSTIVNNVMGEVYRTDADTIIILLHDSGDKRTTVEALPIIIERIADMNNVAFVPITEDIVPIHHVEATDN